MKSTKIIYWILTGLLALGMLASSIPAILHSPQAVTFMTALGYPAYFVFFISVAKIFGVAGIIIPGFPRIKEWAYAGLTFDLIGATYSQIAIGTPAKGWMMMAIWFAVLAGSYVYYHKTLKASLNSETALA